MGDARDLPYDCYQGYRLADRSVVLAYGHSMAAMEFESVVVSEMDVYVERGRDVREFDSCIAVGGDGAHATSPGRAFVASNPLTTQAIALAVEELTRLSYCGGHGKVPFRVCAAYDPRKYLDWEGSRAVLREVGGDE